MGVAGGENPRKPMSTLEKGMGWVRQQSERHTLMAVCKMAKK